MIDSNLSVASWNGEDCLKEFVKHSVKLRLIYETFYRSRAMNALIKAAPALREVAFLGYLTSHHRGVEPALDYDQIVVDCPSTGHFLSCVKVPFALLDITDAGPMGYHCGGIIEVLRDPALSQIYSVVLPEPLVVKEHNSLMSELESLGLKPKTWVNKVFEREVKDELRSLESTENFPDLLSDLIERNNRQDMSLKILKENPQFITPEVESRLLQGYISEILGKLDHV